MNISMSFEGNAKPRVTKNGKPRPSGRGWEKDLKKIGVSATMAPLLGADDPRCWPG